MVTEPFGALHCEQQRLILVLKQKGISDKGIASSQNQWA